MSLLRTITRAYKTVDAIDSSIRADQGAAYRQWLGRVIPHMDDAYRGADGGHRSHMGASLIGGDCARAIWYGFRWSHKAVFDGRVLRLFNRGHLEEARFIAMLLSIGVEVWQQDANGKQFRISDAEGHFGGSGDGVARGIPDLPPGTACLLEFKTHSAKSFKGLVDEGMRGAKFEHYVQMNVYMRKMGLAAGLYLAVNKDNDELYGEIIALDTEVADQFIERGRKLVFASEPPKRISESPGFWKCRFCNHRPVCHLKAEPDLNCRTCRHSAPGPDATWSCALHQVLLDKDVQATGCPQYARHPGF